MLTILSALFNFLQLSFWFPLISLVSELLVALFLNICRLYSRDLLRDSPEDHPTQLDPPDELEFVAHTENPPSDCKKDSEVVEPPEPVYSRDSRFYFPDGEVVILISNTLFKVHRSVLIKDDSVFKDMFELGSHIEGPQVQQEGTSDSNPIVLRDAGDLKQFQALMWASYAKPIDIGRVTTSTEDSSQIPLLVDLVHACHRFRFKTTERWALGVLRNHASRVPASGADVWSEYNALVTMTIAAVLCEDNILLKKLEQRWKPLVDAATPEQLVELIPTLERFGVDRRIIGRSYRALLRTNKRESFSKLPTEQRMRLLFGFYSMSKELSQLAKESITYPHSTECTDNNACAKNWLWMWKGVYSEISAEGLVYTWDVNRFLRMMLSRLKQRGEQQIGNGQGAFLGPSNLLSTILRQCRVAALEQLRLTIRGREENIGSWFVDDEQANKT